VTLSQFTDISNLSFVGMVAIDFPGAQFLTGSFVGHSAFIRQKI